MENELLDYEEDEEPQAPTESSTPAPPKKDVKGSYVSIHSSGFRDFLLKPELLRAIVDCGFEHPSEGGSWGVRPSPSTALSACSWPSPAGPPLLTPIPVPPQSSTSASPRPSWAWTFYAKPSPGWARQLCSCLPPCSRSSPSTDRWGPPSPVTSYVRFSVLLTAHSPLCAWVPGDMKLLAPVCCLLQQDCGEQGLVLGILGTCSGHSLDVPRAYR